MSKSQKTQQKLKDAASNLFWSKGYTQVSLREIAEAASVDVALISRYFGGKAGLFEATLEGAFHWPDLLTSDDIKEVVIRKYTSPETGNAQMAATRMIVLNAADPKVGDIVRKAMQEHLLGPMQEKLAGPNPPVNLALFIAAILGASIAKQSLRLDGMTKVSNAQYEAQLRHMVSAALDYKGD